MWFKIFRCQLALGDFEAAYATVMATPYEDVRKDCLRNLVSLMCEEGHIQPLLHFTFPGLQSDVEKTLSFKARNSDPLSVPNYYSVLYSYHVFRGDLKSAVRSCISIPKGWASSIDLDLQVTTASTRWSDSWWWRWNKLKATWPRSTL